MPLRHRFIHLLMAISFAVTAGAALTTHNDLVYVWAIPVVLVAARAARLAFGSEAQD